MEQPTITVDTEAVMTTTPGEDSVISTADPVVEMTAHQTASVAADTTADNDMSQGTAAEEGVYLPVYNGEVCPVKATQREEITTLLQLGMKQREFLPVYEQLTRLAKDAGAASVKAFVENLYDREEKQRLEQAVLDFGEENGRRFYELERAERRRRYDELAKQEENRLKEGEQQLVSRMANEFQEIRQEHPEYTDIRMLPPSVVKEALEQGISLRDAHNRFLLAEQRRTAMQAASSKAAAAGSTGSLSQKDGDTSSGEREAFLLGLYSRT